MSSASAVEAPPPFLTDDEIAKICYPLVMPAARRRHLVRLGLLVKSKADGSPLVGRAEFVRVMTAAPTASELAEPAASQPNVTGLEQWARERAAKRKHGTKSQGR